MVVGTFSTVTEKKACCQKVEKTSLATQAPLPSSIFPRSSIILNDTFLEKKALLKYVNKVSV